MKNQEIDYLELAEQSALRFKENISIKELDIYDCFEFRILIKWCIIENLEDTTFSNKIDTLYYFLRIIETELTHLDESVEVVKVMKLKDMIKWINKRITPLELNIPIKNNQKNTFKTAS